MFALSLFYSMGNNEFGLDGEKYVNLSEQLNYGYQKMVFLRDNLGWR